MTNPLTGYIIHRAGAYAIQKVATDANGSERAVDWEEGLTHEEAVTRVSDCDLVRDETS